jgi:glucoamylase
MPLAWAHAEYIKLVRSISDGVVFDRLDVVVDRYQPQPGQPPRAPSVIEIWNFSRPVPSIPAGATLRITWPAPFRLRHSSDNWAMWQDIEATATAVNIYYVDLVTEAAEAGSSRVFTFFWTSNQTWKGVNYAVTLR